MDYKIPVNDRLTLTVGEKEYWWCGVTNLSYKMPFTKDTAVRFDMRTEPWQAYHEWIGEVCCNQINPVFYSNEGRWIYCEDLCAFEFKDGVLQIESEGKIEYGQEKNLKEAYLHVSSNYFSATGEMPHEVCFSTPQYCTWMQFLYNQNQEDILAYAHKLIDEGLPAGQFIIDAGWEEYYGYWDFCKRKFPDAKKMCQELIDLGFKVVLWVAPYISPDSDVYRFLKDKDCLIKDENGKPYMLEWWDGFSAVLDLSNPDAVDWFQSQYDYLKETYGISGWKMDGGDSMYYPLYPSGKEKVPPYTHSELYASFGKGMEIKELRACIKNGGKAIIQRVEDRQHSWDRKMGIAGIPERMIAQGLAGYAYTCPDMVGGGMMADVTSGKGFSEELYCRYAQLSTFLPTYQLSRFFWKDSPLMREQVFTMVKRHEEVAPYILELAKHASKTGEPIVRSIAYEFNERPDITDEFLLGNKYLIAPVLEEGVRVKKVYLPTGAWKYIPTGEIFEGGKEIEVEAGITVLPYFERV